MLIASQDLPLRNAVLNFYAALAHEALARRMSRWSPDVYNMLDQAEHYLSAAAEGISSAGIDSVEISERRPSLVCRTPSNRLSATSDRTLDSEVSSFSTPATSIATDDRPASSGASQKFTTIRIAESATAANMKEQKPTNTNRGLAGPLVSSSDCIDLEASLVDTFTGVQNDYRRETSLAAFSNLLRKHSDAIENLRLEVEEATSNRSCATDSDQQLDARLRRHKFQFEGRDFELRSPVGSVDIVDRIRRGRERGWQKERFDPGRYQKLASAAMDDLYT